MTVSTDSEMEWTVSGVDKKCKTWYRIVGDLKSGRTPLICVHGGPGIYSAYLRPYEALHAKYGIPLVFYDQIGCGQSTHLPEKTGDEAFWTVSLFERELDLILEHVGTADNFDFIGQSWGGMLGAGWASKRPRGLRRLILSNSPASAPLWVARAQHYLKDFSESVQSAIKKHEAEKTTDSEEYKAACMEVYQQHTIRVDPIPQDFLDALTDMENDPTVYHTMMGPSEFTAVGPLKDWSAIDLVSNINVPTLVIHGEYDFAGDDAVQPFLDNIPDCKKVKMMGSSHLPGFEDPEAYWTIINNFLA